MGRGSYTRRRKKRCGCSSDSQHISKKLYAFKKTTDFWLARENNTTFAWLKVHWANNDKTWEPYSSEWQRFADIQRRHTRFRVRVQQRIGAHVRFVVRQDTQLGARMSTCQFSFDYEANIVNGVFSITRRTWDKQLTSVVFLELSTEFWFIYVL